jgi:DNA-binding transcriptional regulator YiaG
MGEDEVLTPAFAGDIAGDMDKKPLPTMTPEELRAIRAEMGGTQPEAAARYGVAPLTYKRWELGTREIPGPAVILSKLLLELHRRDLSIKVE